jgi:hypothetical protein
LMSPEEDVLQPLAGVEAKANVFKELRVVHGGCHDA